MLSRKSISHHDKLIWRIPDFKDFFISFLRRVSLLVGKKWCAIAQKSAFLNRSFTRQLVQTCTYLFQEYLYHVPFVQRINKTLKTLLWRQLLVVRSGPAVMVVN